jgi:guanylate cyclase
MVGTLWYSIPFVALAGVGEVGFWMGVAVFAKPLAHALALVMLKLFPGSFRRAFRMVFSADLVSDLAVTFLVGGLFASGLQVGWSLIVVLGALVAFSVREAAVWFVVFVAAVVVSANTTAWVEPLYQLPGDPQADGAFTIIGVTILVFLVMAYFVRQRERYRRQSDDLLHNILPDEIATQLKEGKGMIADHFDAVTVLFADVVNFTPMSAEMTPTELVGLLNEVFTDIDSFVDEVGLEKIKTIGDEYMVAAGVPTPRADHAHVIADLALRIQDHVADKEFGGHPITLRIGINSGPVVAGVIGSQKFAYDLWGDVSNGNVASKPKKAA